MDFALALQSVHDLPEGQGTMQSNGIIPRRLVAPLRQASRSSSLNNICHLQSDSTVGAHEDNYNSFNSLSDQPRYFIGHRSNITAASVVTECEHVLLAEGQKKVHFAADSTSRSRGVNDLILTGSEDLLSRVSSLAMTEMDWDAGNQMEAVTAASQALRDQNIHTTDVDGNGNSSLRLSKLQAYYCG